MNKNYHINSICAKIAVLLSIDKNYNYRQADLLYHLAISDFIDKDGQPKSVNIRNINSVLYYSKYINEAILKMKEYNFLCNIKDVLPEVGKDLEGKAEILSGSFAYTYLFVETLRKNKDMFEDFVFNLTTAHKMCSSTNNVVEKYEALYNDYISRKIEGGY